MDGHNGAVIVDVPSSGTPLFGRADEVENVAALLQGGGVRLVTITGPGGVGKTRLAIEVALRVGVDLGDGAVFVDLAGVSDPGEVAAAVAGTLGVGQSGVDEPVLALRRALAQREVLLVLDNFEQVLAAAHVPVGLVERCPDLLVLVTSRAPLRVRAERVFRLAALPVPIRSSDCAVAEASEFASVELFCERASAIRPDFRLGDDNVAAIAGICRAVDGLPLAVELAAARVNHLKPAVLVERLATGESSAPLDTLTRGASDLPARQRTMRDTIAWSYDLLSPHEQRLLRRMAIFDGDCSLDAIEFVCSDTPSDEAGAVALAGTALLDALAALVDLHLVEPDDRSSEEARFGMLVTIREFGREQLADAGEQDAVQSRHAHYYATLVDEAAVALNSPAEREWLLRLGRENVEIRAALRHFLATNRFADGLRLAAGMGGFWLYGGHIAEGRQWLGQLLGRSTDGLLRERDRAAALMWSARLAIDDTGLGEPANAVTALGQLDDALALARSVGDGSLELQVLSCLATIVSPHDPPERAVARADEGLTRCAELGERWWLPELLNRAARMAQQTADRERAAVLAAEANSLADELGNDRLSIESRITLAFVAPGTAHAGAAPLFADIVPPAEELGYMRILTRLYPAAGLEALAAGRVTDAARWLGVSLELARDSGYWHAGAFGMMGTQELAYVCGQWEAAARLYGALSPRFAVLRRGTPPESRDTWDGIIAAVHDSMGDDAFDSAVRDGSLLSWDAALNEAITICHGHTEAPREPQQARSRPHQHYELELTERELGVLHLIAAGGTNKDVASALGIRAKTVMHHSVAIYRKLGVRGRAEATAYAYRNNLIDHPQPNSSTRHAANGQS